MIIEIITRDSGSAANTSLFIDLLSTATATNPALVCYCGGLANDALTVVVNPENPVSCMTVEQLKSVWEPNSKVSSWSDIEGLEPPYDESLELYGPGSDSGTFGYFTEAINGEEDAIRNEWDGDGSGRASISGEDRELSGRGSGGAHLDSRRI